MSVFMKLVIGLALFLALGWFGIHSGISIGWPGGSGLATVTQKLQGNANSALVKNGLHSLEVKMHGQVAMLSGKVSSEDARNMAATIVLRSTGSGGWLKGGVTGVNLDDLQIVPPVNNPYWNVAMDDGGHLVLSGYIDSEQARDKLLAAAVKVFGDDTEDTMKVVPGTFQEALPQMLALLPAMAKLQNPVLTLDNNGFVLRGLADSRQDAEQLKGSLAKAGGALSMDMVISYPPPPPNKFGVVVEDGPITDIEQCRKLFGQSLSKNQILFNRGKADIGSDSYEFLNFLTDLAKQCGDFTLLVEGHTDAIGEPQFNNYLSKQRAQAVRTYMVERGVRADRISSVGFGSEKPICTERSRSCHARNRRIEITVEL